MGVPSGDRRATSVRIPEDGRLGRLPTFLIVGAPRCGTTSLARYLGANPHVFMAPSKEVHYFDASPDPGLPWYAEQFDGALEHQRVGEATPNYLASALAVKRIPRVLPDVVAIAILRQPADRAYSAFQHGRSIGRETRSFRGAIEDELADRGSEDPWGRPLPPYLAEGRYGEQLERLGGALGRDRILVVSFDELRSDAVGTYRETCAFLGVPPDPVPAVVGRIVNGHQGFRSLALRRRLRSMPDHGPWRSIRRTLGAINRTSRAYPSMSAPDRQLLNELYADDRERLRAWLGGRLPWRTP